MLEVVGAVLLGLAGGLLIKATFRAHAHEWPAHYSDVAQVVDSASSKNIWAYLLFRIVPVFLVSLLLLGIAGAWSLPGIVVLCAFLAVHLLTTTLSPAIWVDVVRQRKGIRLRRVMVHATTAVVLAGVTFVAYSVQSQAPFLAPDAEQLKDGFWVSVLVGIGFALYRQTVKFRDQAVKSNRDKNLQKIGSDNVKAVDLRSAQYQTSPRWILAILATESINRPKWWRVLERFWSYFQKRGTYGIAQVLSDTPLTDEQSIEILCKNYQGFYPPESTDPEYDLNLAIALAKHNPGTRFIKLAKQIYDDFDVECFSRSAEIEKVNNLPILCLESSEVSVAGVKLRFSASACVDHLAVRLADDSEFVVQASVDGRGLFGRSTVEADLTGPVELPVTVVAFDSDKENLASLKLENSWDVFRL